jgi:hypothetical protein
MAPAIDARLPVPIQQRLLEYLVVLVQISTTTTSTVSISSTSAPALPRDITKQYMKEMLWSLQPQTAPADEGVIVVSDVDTKINAFHPEASASDWWCAVTQRNLFVDLFNDSSSESSRNSACSKLKSSRAVNQWRCCPLVYRRRRPRATLIIVVVSQITSGRNGKRLKACRPRKIARIT